MLAAADGGTNVELAGRLELDRGTIRKWCNRFVEDRCDGLLNEPRPGPRFVGDAQIETLITATLETTPPDATHWSTRSMAMHLGLSQSDGKTARTGTSATNRSTGAAYLGRKGGLSRAGFLLLPASSFDPPSFDPPSFAPPPSAPFTAPSHFFAEVLGRGAECGTGAVGATAVAAGLLPGFRYEAERISYDGCSAVRPALATASATSRPKV